jgi:galactose mutarotase-like enzyme
MVMIHSEQRQYLTYVLTQGDAIVEVVPDRGGIVTRWAVGGREIFYLDEARFQDPALSVRGGIPLLFPICGNVLDNKYTHNGQTYCLKQHGFARELPWQVLTATDTALTLQLTANAQTLAQYPFDFELQFTYELTEERLVLRQKFINHGAEAMPFATGIHPYFYAPDKSQLRFMIPSPVAPTTFDWDLAEIDTPYRDLTALQTTVKDGEHTLSITYDAHYTTLIFWTLKGKDFYCLEPWSAPRQALNTGTDLIWVAPGATEECVISLSVAAES